jgi:hypothetical protein
VSLALCTSSIITQTNEMPHTKAPLPPAAQDLFVPFYKQCGSVLKSMMDPDESDSDADGAPRRRRAAIAPAMHRTARRIVRRQPRRCADGAPRITMPCVLCGVVTLSRSPPPLPHQANVTFWRPFRPTDAL